MTQPTYTTRCRQCDALEPDGPRGYCYQCVRDAFRLGLWCVSHGIFTARVVTVEPWPGMTYLQWAPPSEQHCPWCVGEWDDVAAAEWAKTEMEAAS